MRCGRVDVVCLGCRVSAVQLGALHTESWTLSYFVTFCKFRRLHAYMCVALPCTVVAVILALLFQDQFETCSKCHSVSYCSSACTYFPASSSEHVTVVCVCVCV